MDFEVNKKYMIETEKGFQEGYFVSSDGKFCDFWIEGRNSFTCDNPRADVIKVPCLISINKDSITSYHRIYTKEEYKTYYLVRNGRYNTHEVVEVYLTEEQLSHFDVEDLFSSKTAADIMKEKKDKGE